MPRGKNANLPDYNFLCSLGLEAKNQRTPGKNAKRLSHVFIKKVTGWQVAQVVLPRQHVCTTYFSCNCSLSLSTFRSLTPHFPTQQTHTGGRAHTQTRRQAFSWDVSQKSNSHSQGRHLSPEPKSAARLLARPSQWTHRADRPQARGLHPRRGPPLGPGAGYAQAQRPRGRLERASPRRQPGAARRRASPPRLTLGSPEASAPLRAFPGSRTRSCSVFPWQPSGGSS